MPQRKVALVKNNYSYKLKAYAPHLLDDIAVREVPIYKLTIDNGGLPDAGAWLTPDIEKQYRAARRVIMSLESFFSAVGGALLLGEVMTTRAYIGCALIFIGTVLAQVPVKIPRLLRKRE